MWSLIKFGSVYDASQIRLWYLDRKGLQPLWFDEILGEDDNMLVISKPDHEGTSYIPYHRVYAIDYDDTLILDRRSGYQGNKSMVLPPEISEK